MEAKVISSGVIHTSLPQSYVRAEGDRPMLSEVSECDDVPIIDLGCPDRALIARQIGDACRYYGFFQVINHGVAEVAVERTQAVAKEFFDLPVEEKLQLYSDDPSKTMRLSTSFNVKKESVHNWRDYLRLPLEKYAPEWPSNPPSFRQPPEASNHLSGEELRIDIAGAGAGAGLDYELPSAGTVEQDEEAVQDLESQLGSNDNRDAPVPGLQERAYLSLRAPPYILFGLATNVTLTLIYVKLIHELELPGSTPTLPEVVLAAAAGIGLSTSLSAICLQVKDPRSVLAKVLSQISTISLGCSLLVKLSTRFLFEQYMPVNIVTTAVLFLFMVGMVILAGM